MEEVATLTEVRKSSGNGLMNPAMCRSLDLIASLVPIISIILQIVAVEKLIKKMKTQKSCHNPQRVGNKRVFESTRTLSTLQSVYNLFEYTEWFVQEELPLACC